MGKAKRAPEPTGYNGWSNYETWCVNVWLSNDEGSYRYWRSEASDAIEEEQDSKCADPASNLAERLKAHFDDERPELEGVWADLLGAALSEVDWHEIAANMLEGST